MGAHNVPGDGAPDGRLSAEYVRPRGSWKDALEWAGDLESLLREARDLLWHKRDHSPSGKQDCPGCRLEARIDAALTDGPVCDP